MTLLCNVHKLIVRYHESWRE